MNNIHESSYVEGCIFHHTVRIHKFCNIYGCEIGENTQIGSHVTIQSDVKIGKNCKIGDFVFIPAGTVIQDAVFIGAGTKFCNDKYPYAINKYGKLATTDDWKLSPVFVNDNVSIGINCTVLPGLRLEFESVLGAGSVLTKDLPAQEVWVGNPARKLRNLIP